MNRTLPCLCVDTFTRNTFRDSGETLFGIVCTGSTVLFCWELSIGSIESSSGAMYFDRFDLLGLTTTEDCAWSRSYELLLLSLTLRFKRPSYRNNGASWENWERYSLNGSRWGM